MDGDERPIANIRAVVRANHQPLGLPRRGRRGGVYLNIPFALFYLRHNRSPPPPPPLLLIFSAKLWLRPSLCPPTEHRRHQHRQVRSPFSLTRTEAPLPERAMACFSTNRGLAAIEEGIVPRGGAAFVHLFTHVPGIKDKLKDADECLGADIMQKALVAPAALLAHNAGVEGEVVVEKIEDSEWEVGCNAMTDKYENLLEANVIDPAQVTRCALQNAASVAGMVLM